jgi:hypothetical protein
MMMVTHRRECGQVKKFDVSLIVQKLNMNERPKPWKRECKLQLAKNEDRGLEFEFFEWPRTGYLCGME